MREVVIVSAARTAIGSFGGSLKDVPVVELGRLVIKETLLRAGIKPRSGSSLIDVEPKALKDTRMTELERSKYDWDKSLRDIQVDEVIMGNVLPAGQGQNIARQSAINAGIPKETSAFTLNKLCASGMKAIALAAQSVAAGQSEVIIAGGMENMSGVPYALPRARWGYRMDLNGKADFYDLLLWDGLLETFYGYHMGMTAENIAAKCGISRKDQDEISLLSHQRARKAIADGAFKQEIVPVLIPSRKGDSIYFDTDERPMDTSMEKLAKLPTPFKKDGTVSAGNSSGVNDAAAAVLIMSRDNAKAMGLEIMGTIKAYASAGVDPAYMGFGVIPAVRKVLQQTGMTIKDMDLIELNEAFAAQALGCIRELDINLDNTNLMGSGISLGHPIGCTGARLVVTLTHAMKRLNKSTGLATMCVGGGQGMAMIIERS